MSSFHGRKTARKNVQIATLSQGIYFARKIASGAKMWVLAGGYLIAAFGLTPDDLLPKKK